ncbi:type I-E CRISPR-associated protein Cas5/CasD [Novosphingobium sp. FSW06-99]|uniref:type I-E CRISPR-associated protein Cas5/CasD n=1 Tax=Novosphingobium sp. FSW06-99 TaxID=1739113 RepID=UPI000ABD1308|nr:type I-E CRISPR-associated protein Cas5/CasD [Novosphingobium sp. FSW06-99]
MADYLVFTLAAMIGAMGDLAGHERRGTHVWPARSAVLGLLGAATGVRRDDSAGLARLDRLSMAVGQFAQGVAFRDFHTAQTIPAAFGRVDGRADGLRRAKAAGKLNTVLTQRDYRAGLVHGVALWQDDSGGDLLAELADALRQPVFTLYFGRKACPLAMPPVPRRITADDAITALGHVALPQFVGAGPWTLGMVAADCDLGQGHSEWRHDVPIDRARWHFAQRQVHLWHNADQGAAS